MGAFVRRCRVSSYAGLSMLLVLACSKTLASAVGPGERSTRVSQRFVLSRLHHLPLWHWCPDTISAILIYPDEG